MRCCVLVGFLLLSSSCAVVVAQAPRYRQPRSSSVQEQLEDAHDWLRHQQQAQARHAQRYGVWDHAATPTTPVLGCGLVLVWWRFVCIWLRPYLSVYSVYFVWVGFVYWMLACLWH